MTKDISDIVLHLFNSVFSGKTWIYMQYDDLKFFTQLIYDNILYKELEVVEFSHFDTDTNGFTLIFSVTNLEYPLEWNERHCPYAAINVDFSRDWSSVDYGFD